LIEIVLYKQVLLIESKAEGKWRWRWM